MLNTVKNQIVEEFVIFDTAQKIFYPIDSETQVQIGDYNLDIKYENGIMKLLLNMLVNDCRIDYSSKE